MTDHDGELDCGRGGRCSVQLSDWLKERCGPSLARQSPPLAELSRDGHGGFCPRCARRLGKTHPDTNGKTKSPSVGAPPRRSHSSMWARPTRGSSGAR